ncbi:helix-turn-helix domain-containing protein [Ornithinicoccus hortensis]|uniref:helix-turn-helix domain-containing protein n=1 Tax=Ornithinicoccus hortensis TaxID=82346 RepID=UPI001E5DB8C9|nr:helix-turn-helix domain-containing protein [Ornithinicoccus hortensis]
MVHLVESCPDIRTVRELADRSGVGERTLQRLTGRRFGLTPKWLIQRRRLHEAAEHLGLGLRGPAEVAHDLGYADQAHFTRDFRRVTGHTPAAFARTLGLRQE